MPVLTVSTGRGLLHLPGISLAGITAYYPLEEASGTRIDATGRGNDLTSNNSVGQAVGIVGNCASFATASLQDLSRASNTDLRITLAGWSVAGWIYLTSKTTFRMIVTKYGIAAGGREYQLFYTSVSDRFVFNLLDAAGNSVGVATADALGSPALNTWYYIVAWHDGVNIYIQVNNGAVNSAALTGTINVSTTAFHIGGRDDIGTLDMDGRIDEVLIAQRAFSATERYLLYGGGSGRTWPLS